MFLEFLAAENLKNTIPAPLFRGMGHRVTEHRVPYQAGSGKRVLGFLAAENLKNTIPAPSAVACRRRSNSNSNSSSTSNSNSNSHNHNSSRSIGSRQFRAGIVFLEFLAAENLKNTIPGPSAVVRRRRSNSNSKSNNSISNSIIVSHNHNSSRSIGVPPIPSGNRLFGVFSCRKPQKHDSRPFCGGVSGEDPKISIPVAFRGRTLKSRFQVEKRPK